MSIPGLLQIVLYIVLIVALAKPAGAYLFTVVSGGRTWLSPVVRPLEVGFYKLSGVQEEREQGWAAY